MALPVIWIILAVLFLLYGILIVSVRSGTLFYLVWFFMTCLCAFFAAAAYFHWWSLLPGLLQKILIVLIILGCVLFLFVEGLVVSGFSKKGRDHLDYLLVLGAQVYDNGPSVVLKYRLDRAILYLQDNPDTICIVSGGQGENEPFAEADGMAEYLIKHGIDAERIRKEDASLKTIQNIRNSMEMIEEGSSVGIVTNNFHLFRALSIAKKQGLKNCAGIPAGSKAVYLPNNMLREFFGILKDFIVGNL